MDKCSRALLSAAAGLVLALAASGSKATASAEEIARLDGDLTPVGAERAGNAAGTIPPWTGGLVDASLVFEAAGQWVNNLPGTDEERIGRFGNWGAAAPPGGACDAVTRQTRGGCKVDGFATDFSWGYRLFATLSLPRPARGIDLYPLLGWNHDVEGYAVDGSQLEGRQIINLRLRAVYQRAFFLEVGRSWVKSTTNYDPARNKDVYSVAVGVQF